MVGKSKEPSFGEGLLEGLREAVAWKRGDVALEIMNIVPMPLRSASDRTRVT
jgi:putative transcriptional regulator